MDPTTSKFEIDVPPAPVEATIPPGMTIDQCRRSRASVVQGGTDFGDECDA